MPKKGKAVQKPKPKADKVPEKKTPEKKVPKHKKKDSTGWQDELGAELAAYGLRVNQVADQLGRSPDSDHLALRASTVAFMHGHRADFEPFIEEDEEWGHYVERMSREGTWAGQQELVALARDQRLRLRVYQAAQPSWVLAPDFPDFPKDTPEIHLSYHDGAHYNSVRRADDFADGPPALIALGACSAAPAAPAERSFGAREEERVAQEAGCFHDRAAVRAALDSASGRVAQAVEILVERLASEAASGAAESLPPAVEALIADPAALPNPVLRSHPARLPGPDSAAEQHPGPTRAGAAAAALPNPSAPPEPHAAAQQELGCRRDCADSSAPGAATPAALGASSASGSAAVEPATAACNDTPATPCSASQQCASVLTSVPRTEPGARQAADGPASLTAGETERTDDMAGRCGVHSSEGALLTSDSSGMAAPVPALPAQDRAQPAAEDAELVGGSSADVPAQPPCAPAEPGSAAAAARAPGAQEPGSVGSPAANPKPGGKPSSAVGARAKARAPPRNRACPCASGKRYKECCGPVAAAAARRASTAPAAAELGRPMATLYV